MTKKRIAILSNNGHSPWLKRLARLLGDLGEIEILTECAWDTAPVSVLDLIVVDTSGLQMELAERVAWLHGRFPESPIVVLTSSPTWRRARAVLQAGAADYMRRSLEDQLLLKRCRLLMEWQP